MLKGILSIITGNVVIQLLNLSILPIITNLYIKDDVGLYGIALAIINVLSISLSMRFEYNIIEEKSKKELSLFSSICFCIIALLIISPLFFLISYYRFNYDVSFIVLVISSSFLYAIHNIAISKLIASAQYLDVSKANLIRTLFQFLFQIAFALSLVKFNYGLIFGYLFSFIFSILFVFFRNVNDFKVFGFHDVKDYLIDKFKGTLYAGVQALVNALSQSIPYLVLPLYFGQGSVAVFFLADKIFRAPINLLGKPIRQVFLKYSSDTENLTQLKVKFLQLTGGGVVIGIVIFIITYLIGNEIFLFLFGDDYSGLIDVCLCLCVWGIGTFGSFPALSLLRAKGKNKLLFNIEIIFFVIKATVIYLASSIGVEFIHVILSYSILNFFMAVVFISFAYSVFLDKNKLGLGMSNGN